MARRFLGLRTGTREQWQAYRTACADLFRNTRYERAAGIRAETPRYLALNGRLNDLEKPLSRVQASWHWRRAGSAEDKEHYRLQRTADQQRRQARRGR